MGILSGVFRKLEAEVVGERRHEIDLCEQRIGHGTGFGHAGPFDHGWNSMAAFINISFQATQGSCGPMIEFFITRIDWLPKIFAETGRLLG